jgi:hypothetical protein
VFLKDSIERLGENEERHRVLVEGWADGLPGEAVKYRRACELAWPVAR